MSLFQVNKNNFYLKIGLLLSSAMSLISAMELTSNQQAGLKQDSVLTMVTLSNSDPIISPITNNDDRIFLLQPLFSDDKLLNDALQNGLVYKKNTLLDLAIKDEITSLHTNPFNQSKELEAYNLAKTRKFSKSLSTIAQVTDPALVTSLLFTVKRSEDWLNSKIYEKMMTSLLMSNTRITLNALDNERFPCTVPSHLLQSVTIPTLLELCYDVVIENESVKISSDVVHCIFSENLIDAMWTKKSMFLSLFRLTSGHSFPRRFIDKKIKHDKQLLAQRARITEQKEKSEELIA
jgi:hypothetical protein